MQILLVDMACLTFICSSSLSFLHILSGLLKDGVARQTLVLKNTFRLGPVHCLAAVLAQDSDQTRGPPLEGVDCRLWHCWASAPLQEGIAVWPWLSSQRFCHRTQPVKYPWAAAVIAPRSFPKSASCFTFARIDAAMWRRGCRPSGCTESCS